MQEGAPFRPFRLANQSHVSFPRKPVAFAGITRNAGAHYVLPRGIAAAVARDDMIQIEIVPVENVSAVLAGILVALENVVAGELHFLFRQSIENEQHDHSWNPDFP